MKGVLIVSEITMEGVEKLLSGYDKEIRKHFTEEIDKLRTETIIAFKLLSFDEILEEFISELDKFSTKEAFDYFMDHPEELSDDSYKVFRQNHKAYNYPRKIQISHKCKRIMDNVNQYHDKIKSRLTDAVYERIRKHIVQIIKETGIEWHNIIPDMTIEEWKD